MKFVLISEKKNNGLWEEQSVLFAAIDFTLFPDYCVCRVRGDPLVDLFDGNNINLKGRISIPVYLSFNSLAHIFEIRSQIMGHALAQN